MSLLMIDFFFLNWLNYFKTLQKRDVTPVHKQMSYMIVA